MRDTATRRRSNITNPGDTPTPEEKSEQTKPEHHRQDRPQPTSFRRKPESRGARGKPIQRGWENPPSQSARGLRGMPEGGHPHPSPLMLKGELKGV